VEERLDLIARLRRKYGATIHEVLAYADEAAAELDSLTHRDERIAELDQQTQRLREEIGALATQLSRVRQQAAVTLARAMEAQLDTLHMKRARFEVQVRQEADGDGVPADPHGTGDGTRYACGATGIDRIEFLIAPNQGEPLKPLSRIASGGETSRMLLALKTILARADTVPVLIFDEIDAGISGRAGQVVGDKLWQLGRSHQVICVTHLPQIAALGDAHFRVAKHVVQDRTITEVQQLAGDERVTEIAQLLGGAVTRAARENASDLLERAARSATGSLAPAEA
jgi:DNA repair protein RecN (Recombination protein N)